MPTGLEYDENASTPEMHCFRDLFLPDSASHLPGNPLGCILAMQMVMFFDLQYQCLLGPESLH